MWQPLHTPKIKPSKRPDKKWPDQTIATNTIHRPPVNDWTEASRACTVLSQRTSLLPGPEEKRHTPDPKGVFLIRARALVSTKARLRLTALTGTLASGFQGTS